MVALWLVAPLISRLPTPVQGKVLKAAASVLETGQLRSSRLKETAIAAAPLGTHQR